jgi:pilus assembly protein CpaF
LEDTRELKVRDGEDPQNCVYMTSVSKRLEGGIEIPMSLLVKAALRQRPDALIMGEARGAEMWDLIQAMQTGHGGMLTSVHAINPEELVSRVEYMLALADINRDQKAIANLISTSFQIAITMLMDHSGRRYVDSISAFTGRLPEDAPGDMPNLETLFEGGLKNDFRLKLVKNKTALEEKLARVGLAFKKVVGVAKQEEEILASK